MWSKIILNPKKDNLEIGFLKPEYLFNFMEYPCSLLYLLTVYLEPINQIVTSPKEIWNALWQCWIDNPSYWEVQKDKAISINSFACIKNFQNWS